MRAKIKGKEENNRQKINVCSNLGIFEVDNFILHFCIHDFREIAFECHKTVVEISFVLQNFRHFWSM